MPTKRASYDICEFKAATDGPKGEVTAIVSVFGNVDKVGDRVMAGAFEKSLAEWERSGNPIPVFWSHDWQDPKSLIGAVTKASEVDRGLQLTMQLDIESNDRALQVFNLLDKRLVKEFSFGYEIVDERPAKDGANELHELKLLEAGPTFRGANPATELLTVKNNDMAASDFTPATIYAGDVDVKAGRRHSAATVTELSEIRQHFLDGVARIDSFLGADDADEEPKSQNVDREPTAKSADSEPEHVPEDREPTAKSEDDELRAARLRIERMR